MSLIYMLPAFIVILSIVVFIHEMGHYLAGRMCGVGVKAFSIGFGREIIGWTDKHGTRWKWCLIPLGGYVKFHGDMTLASQPDPEANKSLSEGERNSLFQNKTILQRSFVVVAGPLANFILSIVVFACIFYANGRTIIPPIVTELVEGGAAQAAGVLPGDVIISADDVSVSSFGELQRYISVRSEIPVLVRVNRNDEILSFNITPKTHDTQDQFGNPIRFGLLGVRSLPKAEDLKTISYGPGGALVQGARETGYTIRRTFGFLGELFVGKQDVNQLGGPVRIARMSGQVATLGFVALLSFLALLSVSIGLINLFPIPILDGGHLMFYAIEAIRGKPMEKRVSEWAFGLGLVCILTLMIFVTTNDLFLYGNQLVNYFGS